MIDLLFLGAGLIFLSFLFFLWLMAVKNYKEDKRVLKAFRVPASNLIPKHQKYV
jgi:hypothetical protein